MSRQRFISQTESENHFRKRAFSFAYSNSLRVKAILERMRTAIPALNTDGIRLNVHPERIYDDDLRGSIYTALCQNRGLLIASNDEAIFHAACQAYLDTLIFSGV